MDFHILGPVEVRHDGQALELGGAKQRALLALLVVRAGETVGTERLIDELWGDRPPANAAKTVQVHVSRLRRAFDACGEPCPILTRDGGYVLGVDSESVDARRFEALVAEARREADAGRVERALPRLESALALWRGPPLGDLAYESFAQREVARLEELRLAAREDLIQAKLELGRHAEVVGELEALVDEHPYRERLRAQLMLALYRSERQAEALQAYQDARRRLVDDLGIEPGERLRELERAILAQDSALALRPRAPSAAEATPERGAFVGRDRELEELVDGLDDAFAGRGRLFLVVGEPGIGKSRLTEELTACGRERGARVLVGRCWEAGGAPAFWPWVQSLRGCVVDVEPGALREQLGPGAVDLAQLFPELRELFPDLPPPPPLESEATRFRLFEAAAAFLRRASEAQPIVLVLDDLHAADASSLLLLRFLTRELGSAHVLLLAAFRDVDPLPGRPLTEMLAEVTREPVTRRISLTGLSAPEVAEYVELTASDIASERLVAAVHEESDGNPLFVSEIVRLLAVEGLEGDGAAALEISIPQSVRDVIARRLTHLSDECNRALLLASALGREFALKTLARMSETSEDSLLETLDEAMVARVVTEIPGAFGHLRFAHVVIRDVLYEGLTTARRVRLHRLAVSALEEVYGSDAGPQLAELAHHSIAGSDFDKGLAYARRAGDRALSLVAYEEAARLYETALGALAQLPPDDSTRCDLLLALGDALARGGDLSSAKETFVRAADLAREMDDPHRLARAALGYGGRFVWFRAGNDRLLVPMLEDAIARLPDADPLRARLLARLAGALRDRPVLERREQLTREAVELARRAGDRATLAYALEGTYAALSWPRDIDTWLALGHELIELADETGDREQSFFGHQHVMGARMLGGDLRAADEELAHLDALAKDLRQPAQLYSVAVSTAARAAMAGNFGEATEFLAQTARRGADAAWGIDDTTFDYTTIFQRWGLARERGDLADVREAIEGYVAKYPMFFIFRCIAASMYVQLGEHALAQAELDALAEDEFAALEVGTEWFFGASLLGEVCADLGAARPAADLYEALRPYGDRNVIAHVEWCLGSASRYLGLLASTLGRFEDAEHHFEDAVAMNARMGAEPWVAHTREDYARMLLSRGEPGDSDRAAALRAQAIATYDELGMSARSSRAFEARP